ncbi:MAG: rifampicin phosphotransferase [Pseudonocardiales bacterium]|nr:rifampicin phosphotransferase [Pseudonocardiales bacterium]
MTALSPSGPGSELPAAGSAAGPLPAESWDPLHAGSPPGRLWSRANIGEALPGVLTTLTWDLWEVAAEGATREAFHALGAATRGEARVPLDREERFSRAFYGRGAVQLDFLCSMGDRIPGTSGAAIAEQVFGRVPETLVGLRTRRRYPIIAARMPYTFVRIPSVLRATAADTHQWWRCQIASVPDLDHTAAVRLFSEATARFRRNVALQATTLFCVVQPIYNVLEKLTAGVGVGDMTSLASGYGSVPETAVVADLWRASRGEMDISEVVDRNGFHGPHEGELSSRVWREDATALHRLVAEYAVMDEERNPLAREAALRDRRLELERDILAALPPVRRPLARRVLHTASTVIPLRGMAKESFLQASDTIRAAARRVGDLLASDGTIATSDDVFFLTESEIAGRRPDDIRGLIERRRERYAYYRSIELPTHWQGDPVPIVATAESRAADSVNGVGVSPGVVEGFARVVTDPDFDYVEPGEILVAAATDPSWSSIMFISAALVVDIGGALSHAAIVARELAVPCVVNTITGTRSIRTGDRCRVDGTTGIVTVLERAASSS